MEGLSVVQGGHPLRNSCMQNNCIRIGWDEYGETVTDETNYFVGGKYVLNAFLNRMQLGDIVLSCYSARTIDAIGVITGDPEWLPNEDHYKRSRKVNWLLKGKKLILKSFNYLDPWFNLRCISWIPPQLKSSKSLRKWLYTDNCGRNKALCIYY